jgi:hypothetical protein
LGTIRIIGIGAGGSDDQEIAVAAALAHPLKGGIHVGTAAHQHRARSRGGGDVIGVTQSEVGIFLGSEAGYSESEQAPNKQKFSHGGSPIEDCDNSPRV